MCSRSIVFEVVIYTIIRGLLFPFCLCISRVLTIASVRGSLCGQDVVLSRRACFVCDLFRIGVSTRTVCCVDRGASSFAVRSRYDLYTSYRCWRNAFTFPSTGMIWQAGLICTFSLLEARTEMAGYGQMGLSWDTTSPNEGRHCLPSPLWKAFHCLHCSLYESIRPRIQRWAVTWSNPYIALYIRNTSELYCGPLTEISLSGIPCSSMNLLRWLMIVLEHMFVSFRMIGNMLYKPAIIYSVPFQWNRSVARLCQACFGMSCGISVYFVLATWCAWHGAHDLIISSMSWLIPHQKTAAFVRSSHFSAPWCA